jgi:enterochelin esterase-like enzyme
MRLPKILASDRICLFSGWKGNFGRAILFTGLSAILVACALGSRPAKRARMATAVPSQTAAPFTAPNRSEIVLPSPASSPAPTSVLGCPESAGTLRPETVTSSVLGSTLGFFVYLPPCYETDPQAKYPALFLFHGLGRTPDQWLDLGLTETTDQLIRTGGIPPMIIILPYVSGEDSNDAAFLADLLPAVDAQFQTIPDRTHRSVGGLSRGGEWALRLAIRRADLFGKVGVHSIALSNGILGEIHTWGMAVPETMRPKIFIDCGYADPLLAQTNELVLIFNTLSWPYEKQIHPGDHSDDYWSRNLKEYLQFYGMQE